MNNVFNMLISIKNALISKQAVCSINVKNYKLVFKILRILYEEGYILNYIFNRITKMVTIDLNYYNNRPMLTIIKLFNKASFPLYVQYKDIPAIHKFGISLLILSTSLGIMTHYKALKYKIGGRAICYIQ